MVDIQGNVAPREMVVLRDELGKPLISGSMETFKASAHGTHKAAYEDRELTIPLPNPIPANLAGVLGNASGAPKPVYYADDENYYLVIKDSAGNPVQTIDDWNADNAFSTKPSIDDLVTTNFIANAQFRSLINDKTLYSSDDLSTPGTAVPIARNGWDYYEAGSGGTKIIEFKEFVEGQVNVPFNPKGYLNYSKSVIGTLTESDIRNEIGDARSFSNQEVTYSIWAKSSTSSIIEIIADQEFGSGGSTAVTTIVDSFQLTTSWAQYSVTFTVANVNGKTFGAGNKFRMRVRPPLNAISNVDIVMSQLNEGNTILEFDYQPERLNQGFASAAAIPQPTGTLVDDDTVPDDDGKSLTLDNDGITNVWRSNPPIGCPIMYEGLASSIPDGYLLCDGTLYKTSDYTRLQTVIGQRNGFDYDFIKGVVAVTAKMTHVSGESGLVVAAADVSTGFTITNENLGTDYGVKSYFANTHHGLLLPKVVGSVTASAVATSPFTISFEDGNTLIPARTFITFTAGSTISGGDYWTYSTTTINYYVWYKVDGAGADPAPGGTGILIEVLSTDTAETIAHRTMMVLDERAIITITTLAASALTAGDYFTMNSVNYDYAFWYSIDGAGTAPTLPGKEIVEVALVAADTAAQVHTKTHNVLHKYTFRVSDRRGMVSKGVDSTGANDPNYDQRIRIGSGASNEPGSIELDFVRSHRHAPAGSLNDFAGDASVNNRAAGGDQFNTSPFTAFFGKERNTVYNIYDNYIIKY